jgi:glycine cleavage system H lipoate-binding protein
VKHLRPDIDVIIITGYASVETAVECMKYGAMDYVQKPFTEDELLEFVKKTLIKRQDRIQKLLKPKVHITHVPEAEYLNKAEFAIPGGVFISKNHCWVSMEQDGSAKIGMDDFAKKLIGKVDDVELPNLGMNIKTGQPLFTVKQNNKAITFNSPVSGQVSSINLILKEDLEALDTTPYERNWFCIIDAGEMDSEISNLKIGKAAVAFFQEDIEMFQTSVSKFVKKDSGEFKGKHTDELYIGVLENLEEVEWDKITEQFFKR